MRNTRWTGIPQLVAASVFGTALLIPAQTDAYTPDSPEVRQMIEAGLRFLESPDAEDDRLGADCLAALPFVKEGRRDTHPRIAQAVEHCRKVIDNTDPDENLDLYSLGIAIIFLCDTNSSKYRPEIDALLNYLESLQKTHGGWGYPERETGDTSMTQYGVLATWTANSYGIGTSRRSAEAVCNWLIRTQDPTGGWGYQGSDPEKYQRIEQNGVSLALSAAGTGSVFILYDLLGFQNLGNRPADPDLPTALKPVDEQNDEIKRRRRGAVDSKRLHRAMADGNKWFEGNYTIKADQYVFYYMYALERFKSFQEKAQNLKVKEPKWYDEGVELLARNQKRGGKWTELCGHVVDTSFALLFLQRSTSKTIESTSSSYSGTLVGGRGLPSDTSAIRLRRGKVIREKVPGAADELLDILESPDHPDYRDLVSDSAGIELNDDPTARAKQTQRLRRVTETGHYLARMIAVRTLARTRDLDEVPTLIFALTDQDWRVVREGRDGLRFVSRRFNGFGMPAQANKEEKVEAVKQWKQWYRSVRPHADFIN